MTPLQVLREYTAGEASGHSTLRTQRVLIHLSDRDMSVMEYSEAINKSIPQATDDLNKAKAGKYISSYLSDEKGANNKRPRIFTLTEQGAELFADLMNPFSEGGKA